MVRHLACSQAQFSLVQFVNRGTNDNCNPLALSTFLTFLQNNHHTYNATHDCNVKSLSFTLSILVIVETCTEGQMLIQRCNILPTCENPVPDCSSYIYDCGCEDDDMVWSEDMQACVHPNECICEHDGKEYPNGENYLVGLCTECTCMNGEPQCNKYCGMVCEDSMTVYTPEHTDECCYCVPDRPDYCQVGDVQIPVSKFIPCFYKAKTI